ncbi:MAG: META domain-containing protein [Xanthobacteraceae bacterium]|jgi:heat shock protein HslJ|nr:META domain-containing protein [Xanthobacteraceae bacterium]MBV9234760.1 META domain-containing protein [Xanthobacteraceae bacterium]
MVRTSVARAFALGLMGLVISAACALAQEDFPFEHELLLDAHPMKGSKRIPNLSVEPDGTATIDLWCNSMQAQINVNGEAISISAGEKSNQSCAPERQQADDDLAAALVAVTSWRWDGESLLLIGPKTLRFRQQTN